MNTRIKFTQPIIRTRAEAEALIREITELQISARTQQNELDASITAIRQKYEVTLGSLQKTISEKSTVAQTWAEANPSEFDGKKSLDMTHGIIGWRTGQPQPKPLSGWTWDRVLEKLKAIGLMVYVRTKEEVNKQGLLADREMLGPEKLREIGVRIIQEESFFIEPKITEQETRIVREAA